MASCVRHPMAVAEYVCGSCGHDHCAECVVFPKGHGRPPLCIPCALEAGGVRSAGTARPTRMSRREVRRRLKENEAARRAREEKVPEPVASTVGAAGDEGGEWWGDFDRLPDSWRQTY